MVEQRALGSPHESLVVDLHLHGRHYLPGPAKRLYHLVSRRRPAEVGLAGVAAAGIDLAVATAVGDPIVTRWHLRRSPWEAVDRQLVALEREAIDHDLVVVRSAGDLATVASGTRPGVMLGVEGADALGHDLDGVDRWRARGVRLVVLVHLADNQFGTTCLPWQQYSGPLPARRAAAPGLSALGRAAIARMQRAGILVDLSHADGSTLRDAVAATEAPLVASHSGARAVQDFPRYLTDDELRLVASTGGVVGLWPYRSRRRGVSDVHDLIAHARHIAEVIGPEHLSLGTDTNGVPGVMDGYRGPEDLAVVVGALLDAGFGDTEVRGILGDNALRILQATVR